MSQSSLGDPARASGASPGMIAPDTVGAMLRQVGPGLIITAAIVGSGELIVTTKLGADVGFVLLWFIILGCLLKVFVQIELGRYALSRGRTTLQAMDSLPGPRFLAGWMVYIWLFMFVATFFQLAGIVGTIAGVFRLGGSHWSETTWAVLITLSCALLLAFGRYRTIERVSTIMVGLFTLFTIFAVGALWWTDYAIELKDLVNGFRFQLPEKFTTALAAFGIIGVGASELIYYPYWCLEKGYARHVGPNDGSAAWVERARGWMRVLQMDAWLSMVVYTGATVAFYCLGAAVLHDRAIQVTDTELVSSLSQMYSASFGQLGLWVFLIGAFVVLYSTVFIATASNGRLMADALCLFRLARPSHDLDHARLVRISCVLLPVLYLLLYLLVGQPLTLVLVGALAQAIMLPLLCLAALYFHYRQTEPALKTGSLWTALLWLACVLMSTTGVYELMTRLPSSGSLAVRPTGLQPGDTIMFVAPARGVDRTAVERARERLEALGFRVVLPDNLDRRRGYLAGSDQERADELMEAFRREDVDAVFPFTGGYGTTRLLDRLDFGQIAAHPKILIGFSDITGLHLAIASKTNLVTFHTPNPDTGLGRPEGMDPFAERFFWRCLRADQNQDPSGFVYEVPDAQQPLLGLRPGIARGRLIGGNLSLVCALMGTPYEIQTQGRVLFLEDVHEAPYRIDRYLSQLRLAGKLESPAAVILGQFTEADPSPNEDSLTVREVLNDYFGTAPYPVVANFPAGHVAANATLPIGVEMEVDVQGEMPQVRVLENPVRSPPVSRR